MDWETVVIVMLIWSAAGLLAAIAFGRATDKDEDESTGHHG